MSLKRPAEGGESCEQDSLFLFIIDPLVISLPSPEHIQVIPGREHFSHLVKHIQIPTCIYKHRTEQQASYDKKGVMQQSTWGLRQASFKSQDTAVTAPQ